MINKRILANNLFFLFLGHSASGILFFVSLAYLARVLGPGGFGVISFAEVIFMFFLTLSSVGLPYLGTREVAKHAHKAPFYVDRILTIRLFLGALAFFLLSFYALLSKNSLPVKIVIFAYGAALIPASLLLDWLFQGLEKMYFIALAVFIRALIFVFGVFMLVHKEGEIKRVAFIFFVSWLVSSGVTLYVYIRRYGCPKVKLDFFVQKKFLIDSLPIGVSLFVGWIIHYFDSTLIFFLKGKEAAGQYNAAYRPIILMVTALAVFFNAIFPAMSRASESSGASMQKIVNLIISSGLSLLLPIALIGTFYASTIVKIVYGVKFYPSAPIFGLLIWWPLLVLIISAFTRILFCYDKQNAVGRISIVDAIFNICFNLLLIPIFSGFGASLAKIAADILIFFIYLRHINKIIDIPIFNFLKPPLIACGAMLIFFALTSRFNVWAFAAGIISYIFVLIFFARLNPQYSFYFSFLNKLNPNKARIA